MGMGLWTGLRMRMGMGMRMKLWSREVLGGFAIENIHDCCNKR